MELIAENGLHNTPMSRVIKRSGVSAGAIYNYFPSKEAIITQLYLDLKTEIIQAVLRDYDIHNSFKARFFQIWRNMFKYLISNAEKMSFVEQCSTSPLIPESAREAGKKTIAPLNGFILEGIQSGILKQIDLDLLFSLIYGSLLSAAKLQLSGSKHLDDSMVETAIQCCWDGIKSNG